MPLEIRELVIKTSVQQPGGAAENPPVTEEVLEQFRKEIIEECLEKMLQLLEKMNKR